MESSPALNLHLLLALKLLLGKDDWGGCNSEFISVA